MPLAGAILLTALSRLLPRPAAGWLASGLVAAAFLLSLQLGPGEWTFAEWLPAIGANWAFRLDELSLGMVRLVTGIASLIHVYSIAYMKDEEGFTRYFAALNLFVFFMLILVMADNLALTFAGWEGVGLASYLLIGFYWDREAAVRAANKAFLVNRAGDAAFLLAMFALLATAGSLRYTEFLNHPGAAAAAAVLLAVAAFGKSAQYPLYIWLPDAMEGPTPVSALIHAATMVTAGVYLLARCQPLLGESGAGWIAAVGAFTALLAGLLAAVQTDIKRTLAYSTVSQLGLMFLALGTGAYRAAMLHLLTHAFFKALLFLGAGSVIHGLHGEQDLRFMGGLRHAMPWTFRLMTVGMLAIAGIPGLSGFFSKERIVAAALHRSPVFGGVCLAVAFLTAFYMWRLWRLTFLGASRTVAQAHESPALMLVPMAVLAIGSITAGWGPVHFEPLVLGATLVATAFGIFAAHRGLELPGRLQWLHATDGLVQAGIVRGLGLGGGALLAGIDRWVVDGLVRVAAALTRITGRVASFGDRWLVDGAVRTAGLAVRLLSYPVRVLQSGSMQSYAAIFLAGAAAFLGWALIR